MANSDRASREPVYVVVPGRLETRTGGYEYDRRIIAGLRALGWSVHVIEVPGNFPFPSERALDDLATALAGLPDGALVVADGLAFGAAPEQVRRESRRLRFAALVHHPLARETGLDPAAAAALLAAERRALEAARAVIVTSRATIESLRPYGVDPAHVTVVPPGTEPAPVARGSGGARAQLLAVGSLVPRKGYDVLIGALASLPDRDWRLTCVGSLERDAGTVGALRDQIRAHDLDAHVELHGEAGEAEMAAFYDAADVFVLPTFHEGYGMAVAEALARGVPVVSTPTGGIPDLIGEDAGVIVPIGDVPALARALSRLLSDPGERERLRAGARRRRATLETWDTASRAFSGALERL